MIAASKLRTRSLMVAGGVAVVAVACQTIITPAPPQRPAGQVLKVDVVGDSLVRQSTPTIKARMDYWGFPGATIVSHPGKTLDSPEISGALNTVRSKANDIVVVVTSSNDAVAQGKTAAVYGQQVAEDQSRTKIRNVLSSFGDRCVVVMTAKENVSPLYDPAQAVAFNNIMRNEVGSHQNTVLSDWAVDSANMNPAYFEADQLHFGPDPYSTVNVRVDGANGYANAITRGVMNCKSKLQPA